MEKKEFIKSVKDYSDEYVSGESFKKDTWEHYSDDAWGEIYDMGDVYHTDQIILDGTCSQTRKLVADNEWFVNWVREEFQTAKNRGIKIELHILGAIIQKDVIVNPNGWGNSDGGWIRYVKKKVDEN